MGGGRGEPTKYDRAVRAWCWGCLLLAGLSIASCVGLPYLFPISLW